MRKFSSQLDVGAGDYLLPVPTPLSQSLSESFVGKLCRNRPLSKELRQSISTKIDDKVGIESFGTSSTYSRCGCLAHTRHHLVRRKAVPGARCLGRPCRAKAISPGAR